MRNGEPHNRRKGCTNKTDPKSFYKLSVSISVPFLSISLAVYSLVVAGRKMDNAAVFHSASDVNVLSAQPGLHCVPVWLRAQDFSSLVLSVISVTHLPDSPFYP